MRYGQMRAFDTANGEGIRSTLFVVGCTHKCPGCFNKEYQDFQAGKLWNSQAQEELLGYVAHPQVSGLTLLGGEPMQNTSGLIDLCQEFRKRFSQNKSLWIYSGYTFEEICKTKDRLKLLSFADVLVDGLFIESLKDLRLAFRGSSNQRLIEVQKSLAQGSVVLYTPQG